MKKILQKREECIGCGTCVAICPEYWEMADDMKATLKGSKKNNAGEMELEVSDVSCNKDAADSCPVQIIEVRD